MLWAWYQMFMSKWCTTVDQTVFTLLIGSPHLPLPHSSPGGARTQLTVVAPADEAYYSLIDPVRMKGWVGLVGWPTADGLPVYPYKWSAISCRSGADQWKFAGQRPTFYHWATQPTLGGSIYFVGLILLSRLQDSINIIDRPTWLWDVGLGYAKWSC